MRRKRVHGKRRSPFRKKNPLVVGGLKFLQAMLVPTKAGAPPKYDLSKEEDIKKLEEEKTRNEKFRNK